MGDGVSWNVEFHSKMNALVPDVIQGLMKGVELAERTSRATTRRTRPVPTWAWCTCTPSTREYDELNLMIAQFQQAKMRMRYSSIPVVSAPHLRTSFGGGCELNLHADSGGRSQFHMGLRGIRRRSDSWPAAAIHE
jgi:3-hydroxyacyl-CoA dehydrogenase